jgi:hypothetical protein
LPGYGFRGSKVGSLFEAALDRHYVLPEPRRITALDGDRPVAEVLLEVVAGLDAMFREHRQFVQLILAHDHHAYPRARLRGELPVGLDQLFLAHGHHGHALF